MLYRILTTLCMLVAGFEPCLGAPLQSTNTATGVPPAQVCASVTPVPPDDVRGAFAYEFESPAIVAFLADLKHVPPGAQRGIFLNAVAAASTPEQHDLENLEAMACPNLDEAYGRIRGLVFVTNLWQVREIHDADKFRKFASVLSDTISALSVGDGLTSEQRRLAFAPLADPVHTADPAPNLSPSNDAPPCKKPNVPPQVLGVKPPVVPLAARLAQVQGTVKIRLDISETGDTLSAREVSDEFHNVPGAEELVRSVIFVAATAVIAPEIKDCKPVRSEYVFTVWISP